MKFIQKFATLVAAFILACVIVLACVSCSAVRTITTSSSYVQHGDTSTQIVTKTVEHYKAQKFDF